MARHANQKQKLLVLLRVLWEQSDDEHPMTVGELLAALERQGLKGERKSIYTDMEALRAFGIDVVNRRGKGGGWYLGERTFQLAELKLLVDAVQSSRFITRRKSSALIHKLESQASVHQARQLQRQVYASNRIKTMNESIYYTVDKLYTALNARRAVSFRYFEYNVQKKPVFRREGQRYAVSPWGLIWASENYYLVGFDHAKGDMRHYRVDKMTDLVVTCLERRGDEGSTFDMASYAQKHFGMFRGREGQLTLRCRSRMVGVILDRFGQEVVLVPDGPEHFSVTITAVVSPQFLGWLFGLGDAVELCSPDWAVEALLEQLESVKNLYQPKEELP